MADDLPSWGLLVRIELERVEELTENLCMLFRLFQILLPLVFEFRIDGALEGGLIHFHTSQFRFQRLI